MRNFWLGHFSAAVLAAFLTFLPSFSSADDKATSPEKDSILAANGLVDDPNFMVHQTILAEIDAKSAQWRENYEKVKSIADIEQYQNERKDFFLKQLGELWETTPLHPQMTGVISTPDYRVEKIVIETHPKFYATGTLFLPLKEKFAPPYPGLLLVCGHTANGKASDDHQTMAVLGAMNGLAVLVFDPIEQGERYQNFGPDGKMSYWGTAAHNMLGATSILLGRNTATFEFWDNSRAIDYLQSRSDIISDKIGVAGNSGGGTQTSYMMALDPRVAAAAPCCYLSGFFGHLTHILNPQDAEQNIFGQIGFGMDHPDYPIMRAPKPTLLCCKTDDFFFVEDTWTSFRFAKRIFSRFAAPEHLSIIEIEGGHGYCPEIYNSTIRWMVRWLTDRTELTVTLDAEKMVPILPEEVIRSIPDEKGVMSLPGARTTYDLNRDLNSALAEKRKANLASMTPDDFADMVRKVAVIRKTEELPEAKEIEDKTGSGDVIFETAAGIYCPVRTAFADSTGETLRLIVTSQGRRGAKVEAILAGLAAEEGPACAVDLRGWGETQNVSKEYFRYEHFGTDGIDFYGAYLLGKSFVGMRTEDLLVTAKRLTEKFGKKIELIADSSSAAIVALHAATVAPDLFAKVTLPAEEIPTWNSRVEAAPAPIPMTDIIHGVLNYYDVDDLIARISK